MFYEISIGKSERGNWKKYVEKLNINLAQKKLKPVIKQKIISK